MSPARLVTPFFEIDFERDEVERAEVGFSFLLLDADESDLGFCLSGPSGLFDRRERFSAGMICRTTSLVESPGKELSEMKVRVSIQGGS